MTIGLTVNGQGVCLQGSQNDTSTFKDFEALWDRPTYLSILDREVNLPSMCMSSLIRIIKHLTRGVQLTSSSASWLIRHDKSTSLQGRMHCIAPLDSQDHDKKWRSFNFVDAQRTGEEQCKEWFSRIVDAQRIQEDQTDNFQLATADSLAPATEPEAAVPPQKVM